MSPRCSGPPCCPCQRLPVFQQHSPPYPDGPAPWSDILDSHHQRPAHRSAPATHLPQPWYSAQRILSIFVNYFKLHPCQGCPVICLLLGCRSWSNPKLRGQSNTKCPSQKKNCIAL